MRDLRDRLQDILEAIGQIEVERAKGREAFDSSQLVQVWMVHHLMIIGEAARTIDPATRQRYQSVPWRQIAGMRISWFMTIFALIRRLFGKLWKRTFPR